MATLPRALQYEEYHPHRRQQRSTLAPVGVPTCGVAGERFACTRRLLHPGDHHAHVSELEVVAAWPRK